MIQNILIFIIFLGPLIFFHELGHFLFARLFGVRVEVFSIGFGPKFLKWKWGETEYALSLIPLGGYVKMFGDDPFKKDEISETEKSFSFNHKGKWARFCIVFGGPLANFILAFIIFFLLNLSGQKIPEMKLGPIEKSNILYLNGLRTSDVLKKVNNRFIDNPGDILTDSKIKTLSVLRNDKTVKLNFIIGSEKFLKIFMKIPPILRKPIVVNRKGEKFAISLNNKKIDWNYSLENLENIKISRLYLFKLNEGNKRVEFSIQLNIDNKISAFEALTKNKYYGLDLQVKSISMDSAAEKAGIFAGDIIISLNKQNIFNFEQLKSVLQKTKSEIVPISLLRKGKLLKLNVEPKVSKNKNKETKLIGVYSNAEFIAPKLVNTKAKGVLASLSGAYTKTKDSISMTFDYFIKLISAKISAKSIGGPLTIGKVAADSFRTSLSYFFQLMALISVNLGVINLFPVPVLDGGHIMFIIVEIFNKKSLSRRKMEIAQQFGLSLLLLLMGWSLINDFTRLFN